MKLTKKKLIQAVRPGLEKLGYLYISMKNNGNDNFNKYHFNTTVR